LFGAEGHCMCSSQELDGYVKSRFVGQKNGRGVNNAQRKNTSIFPK